MEPLHPDLRRALKEAHPELTDEIIDRVEELRGRRFEFDPVKDADEIARLDRERMRLIAQHMPHYQVVAQTVARTAREIQPPRAPVVTIKDRERPPRS